jgi:hypothetical protein
MYIKLNNKICRIYPLNRLMEPDKKTYLFNSKVMLASSMNSILF